MAGAVFRPARIGAATAARCGIGAATYIYYVVYQKIFFLICAPPGVARTIMIIMAAGKGGVRKEEIQQ